MRKKLLLVLFIPVLLLMKAYASALPEDKSMCSVNYVKEGNIIDVPLSGDFITRTSVVNGGQENKTFMIITAVYDNDTLDRLYYDQAEVEANDSATVESDTITIASDETVKSFVWDEDMTPLGRKDFYCIDFENGIENSRLDAQASTCGSNWKVTNPSQTSAGGVFTVRQSSDSDNMILKIRDSSVSEKVGIAYNFPKKCSETDGYAVSWRIKYSRTDSYTKNENDVGYNWMHVRTADNKNIMSVTVSENNGACTVYTKSAAGDNYTEAKIAVNEWHEFKMVYIDGGNVRFFVDGINVYADEAINAADAGKLAFFTTDSRTNTTYVDDIRIWYDISEETERSKKYKEIDELFCGVFDWMVQLYDPESGGFYSTQSGAEYEGYQPSLEATGFIVAMLTETETGITANDLPEWFKNKLITFFQSRQSAEDGYFYDTGKTPEDYSTRTKARILNQATSKLKALGAAPLYPLPSERSASSAGTAAASAVYSLRSVYSTASAAATLPVGAPSYLASVESFISEIESRDWSNSWTAGDLTASDMEYVDMMPEETRQVYIDAVISWLDEHQDSVTGYWGTSGDYGFNAVSGAFKICNTYNRYHICPPNPEKILNSVVATLKMGYAPHHACYVRNPITVVEIISYYRPELVKQIFSQREEEFLNGYKNYISSLFKPDGGASSTTFGATATFGGLNTGLELCEGDIDGTQQMWIARKYLYNLFGWYIDNLSYRDKYDKFFADLETKPNIVKKSNASGGIAYQSDFNNKTVSDLFSDRWSASAGGAYVKKSPEGSYCAGISDALINEAESLQLSFKEIKENGEIAAEMKYDYDGDYRKGVNDLSYNYIRIKSGNNNFIELVVIDNGDGTFALRSLLQQSSTAVNNYKTIASKMQKGEWFELKIQISDGGENIKYYINGIEATTARNSRAGVMHGAVNRFNLTTSVPRISDVSIRNITITGE